MDLQIAQPEPPRTNGTRLSRRETQVLALLGHGRTARDIAAELRISVKTVNTYRARLREKLGAATNAYLVRYAVLHGLSP